MSDFPGAGHVVLTVNDLAVSRPWYATLFGAEPVLDEDTGSFHHTAWLLPGSFLVSLHQFPPETSEPGPASEFRTGIDHFAFGVGSRDDLEAWARRLDELGIAHGKIVDAHYGSGLAFRDPDNIQLEFFAPPG